MPMVSVIQVGKSFGAERIFEDVSFQIDEHDRIGLVGPNEAGNTTLINMLAGREEADEGNIALARNIRIGYLTQINDFHPENTLREEMLTVFGQVRAWERELGELARQIEATATQVDTAARDNNSDKGTRHRRGENPLAIVVPESGGAGAGHLPSLPCRQRVDSRLPATLLPLSRRFRDFRTASDSPDLASSPTCATNRTAE